MNEIFIKWLFQFDIWSRASFIGFKMPALGRPNAFFCYHISFMTNGDKNQI